MLSSCVTKSRDMRSKFDQQQVICNGHSAPTQQNTLAVSKNNRVHEAQCQEQNGKYNKQREEERLADISPRKFFTQKV